MVGREEEIEELRMIAEGDRSCLVVVYGRRRIGKTFLIREAFNYSFTFSHTGMEKGTLAAQLRQFPCSRRLLLRRRGHVPREFPLTGSRKRKRLL